MPARRKSRQYERYDLPRSPLAQNPTQRELATLVKETRDDLRRLVNYKEGFIVRRRILTGTKERDLAYPTGQLRRLHERLKFHLNKIKHPEYLMSPRKCVTQRDNARMHLDQDQYLTLDIKKFYPSTTFHRIKTWAICDLGMAEDVAGLFTHLVTVDHRAAFGSPVTPVLCALVYRPMLDEIHELALERGLRFTVWVDDITISGKFVPGELLEEIREIIRGHGLRSHKIEFRTGSRPVFITGIGVVGRHLIQRSSTSRKLSEAWASFNGAETIEEKECTARRLLSLLGTLRHVAGASSATGQRSANSMNAVRQKLRKFHDNYVIQPKFEERLEFHGDIPF